MQLPVSSSIRGSWVANQASSTAPTHNQSFYQPRPFQSLAANNSFDRSFRQSSTAAATAAATAGAAATAAALRACVPPPASYSVAPASYVETTIDEQRYAEELLQQVESPLAPPPTSAPSAAAPDSYDQSTSASAAAVREAEPAPAPPVYVSGSASLLHVSSKRITAVTASMPALEAETQKSSNSSMSLGSQPSQPPEPQQQTDIAQPSQQDEVASTAAAPAPVPHLIAPILSPLPIDATTSSPLPPDTLSPAPFEPPPPVTDFHSASLALPSIALSSLAISAVVQTKLSESETCAVELVDDHSTPTEAPPASDVPTISVTSPAPSAFPMSCESVLPGSLSLHSHAEASSVSQSRKPKRSLAEVNGSAAVVSDEQRNVTSPAEPSVAVIASQPNRASASTDNAIAPIAADVVVSVAAAAEVEKLAPQPCSPADQQVSTGEEVAVSVVEVATDAESLMLQRINRSLASFDASSAIASAAPSSVSDGRVVTTAAAKVSLDTASQDDIEEVDDNETSNTSTAQRPAAILSPRRKFNKSRSNAAKEQRAMPRPIAALNLLPPTCPPTPLAPSTPSVALPTTVSGSQPSVPLFAPPLLTPKPKRSLQQSLSELQSTSNQTNSATRSMSADKTPRTPCLPPPVLPPPLLPPRPHSPLHLSDGGYAKRRRVEADSFYSMDGADEVPQPDDEMTDEDSELRRQQCAIVRNEEQINELRRLRAMNAQLASDNQQLRSKVTRLTEQMRQINQQIDKQRDRGERGERVIQMTPIELQELIDRRVSTLIRNTPLDDR